MTPRTGFDAALKRAKNQLNLYELIHDTRQRSIRSDWSESFAEMMHWPKSENLVRVDGHNKNSVLIFREACDISRENFAHEYVSELLRSAVVSSVSALDRMLHDHIVKHCWKLLNQNEDAIPRKLRDLKVSALDARKALEKLRKDNNARPGTLIKAAIQERLHREYTFQSPDSVLVAAKILGVDDFWGKVANRMPGAPEKREVQAKLRGIATRRNQIVHEADLVRTNRHQPSLRPISHSDATEWVEWMEDFGTTVDDVVRASV